MTLGNRPDIRAAGHESRASPARTGLLGFAAQAVGSLVIWMLVNDWAGRNWSTRDFREWLTFNIALTALLAAFGGAFTRRWRSTLVVVTGCLLAVALGCAVFIGYAVVNSA